MFALSMALPEFRLAGRSVYPLWICGFDKPAVSTNCAPLPCEIPRDVSATMCDVMMTLVSMKTRVKTKGPFDPSEVCAFRGQAVYCTSELSLSVEKRKKDNKQGRNDVSAQCLCYVHSVTCLN